MKLYNYLAIICLLLVSPLWGGERDAVHWIGNGTGFVMKVQDKNVLVSIRHCGEKPEREFKIANKKVKARLIYKPEGKLTNALGDGPVVYELPPGEYESLPYAIHPPEKGDLIYTIGYPSGYWTKSYGRVIGMNDSGDLVTDHQINPGQSGGPLLNECGEVIGVSEGATPKFRESWSTFSTHAELTTALAAAVEPEVVVFSIPNCRGCVQLEGDYNAGKFPGYKFTFVKYTGVGWTHPELVKEFRESCQVPAALGYPIIWVRGTANYKAGYGESRGLLGWLVDAAKSLIRGLLGGEKQDPAPFVPTPDTAPTPAPIDEGSEPMPASDEPISPWYGLLGLLTGALHRRYA
jgi:hypothetical protein